MLFETVAWIAVSFSNGLAYLARDISLVVLLLTIGCTSVAPLPSVLLRCFAWTLYGFVQGLVFTGLWVIGHELGHGAGFASESANNVFGFIVHSCLLTPYFSWQSTHRKHHRYTGHMDKDNNHVPLRYREETRTSVRSLSSTIHYVEDTPLYTLIELVLQQLFGMPLYLWFSVTSGPKSCDYIQDPLSVWGPAWLRRSHFNPFASLFFEHETNLIIMSDVGVATMLFLLWNSGKTYGFATIFLLYGQSFMWMNHWIVAITFLQHTHPEILKYEADTWNFLKGASSTIDRDSGMLGRFFFHSVVDYHVVHHLFPRIPFYHALEATEIIRPLLGKAYKRDATNLWYALWREFVGCKQVTPMNNSEEGMHTLWFTDKAGQRGRLSR